MVEWGMPMGPVALVDEVGIDVAAKVAHILGEAFGDRLPVASGSEQVLASGRLGAKNQRGFYLYRDQRRTVPDPEIPALIGASRTPSTITTEQLVLRMVLPMVNEAARCLAEGVVASPGKLDLALIMGTGFPPFRGGLCRWADGEGLFRLVGELQRLENSTGRRFAPSRELIEMAQLGGFERWAAGRV
jgi:3-hydroxyacyl-CoA dehydrogenase/enoyl-CoA hydratase/3-hydroxybutyryl-CoA epimerase